VRQFTQAAAGLRWEAGCYRLATEVRDVALYAPAAPTGSDFRPAARRLTREEEAWAEIPSDRQAG